MARDNKTGIQELLKKTYNACDPRPPASEAYYLDCGIARGSGDLTEEFIREIRNANDWLCFLFSGHLGCGKSSELVQLARALERGQSLGRCYLPVVVDVNDYLDDYDVAATDILLAIVTQLAATLRTQGKELKKSWLIQRAREAADVLFSDVNIDNVELYNAKVKLLKSDPSARQKVREALKPMLGGIVDEVNTVFDDARTQLKRLQPGYQDFVVIVDNLEKIQRVGKKEVGLDSQLELFIENSRHLTGLNAHLVYTVPLPVARRAAGQLQSIYGPLHVLPMVKVEERGTHHLYNAGHNCLRDILQKRLGNVSVKDFFVSDALNLLLKYSGGHVRGFMANVQRTVSYANNTPIPLEAVHKALQQPIRNASVGFSKRQWGLLSDLEASDDQQIDYADPDYLQLLENLSIFEYINGSGAANIVLSNRPWYAVNPILRELLPKSVPSKPSIKRKKK